MGLMFQGDLRSGDVQDAVAAEDNCLTVQPDRDSLAGDNCCQWSIPPPKNEVGERQNRPSRVVFDVYPRVKAYPKRH